MKASEIEVVELWGLKSHRAICAYSALIIGLKMIPEYMALSYEEFLKAIESMPAEDQEKVFRQAASIVQLGDEELIALTCFCKDKNGIPYTKENIKSLNPFQLTEIIVAVCMQIVRIKIDFLTDAEKKN